MGGGRGSIPTTLVQRGRGATTGCGRLLALLLLLVGLTACDGAGELPTLDVELEVEVSPTSVEPGEPLLIRYRWRPGPAFEPPERDLSVFLHLLGPEDGILLQGDHWPPTPVRQWEAGRTVEYERWLYLPLNLEPGPVEVVAGLYDAESRFRLRHEGDWSSGASVARLTVSPRDIAAVPVPVEGWYPMASAGNGQPFHWTRGRAAVLFRNPGGPAILHLSAQAVVNQTGGSQTIVVRVEDHVVARIEVTDQERFTRRFHLSPEVLGDEEQALVSLEVSPTFVPAELDPDSPDDRVLGVRVYTLFLAPGEGGS